MTKETIYFLHIGKTGGTALRTALENYSSRLYNFEFLRHKNTLKDVPEGEKVVFLTRDPITRFVSGFYSRQRKGAPRYKSKWKRGEKMAFERFKTANELAESLSSKNLKRKKEGLEAMKSIMHIKSSYWDWFKNEKYLTRRINDILFVGRQERLNEDFERLKKILRISNKVKLPTDPIEMHKNPRSVKKYLSKKAKQNLKNWYEKDYQFLNICEERGLI